MRTKLMTQKTDTCNSNKQQESKRFLKYAHFENRKKTALE